MDAAAAAVGSDGGESMGARGAAFGGSSGVASLVPFGDAALESIMAISSSVGGVGAVVQWHLSQLYAAGPSLPPWAFTFGTSALQEGHFHFFGTLNGLAHPLQLFSALALL